MRSAHLAVHGCEPTRTAPTPLRRKYAGTGAVLDYIFVSESLEVHDARIAFDQPDPSDEHLCASDHFGLTADVSLR
jgi:endonuclease/exonuclease/phosphatase family metal-dependent hydrolase